MDCRPPPIRDRHGGILDVHVWGREGGARSAARKRFVSGRLRAGIPRLGKVRPRMIDLDRSKNMDSRFDLI